MEVFLSRIFVAAVTDDIVALEESLTEGLTLNDIGPLGRTPIHIACITAATDFLNAAMSMDFDPWIEDGMGRLAMDYAAICGILPVARQLYAKMHPEKEFIR